MPLNPPSYKGQDVFYSPDVFINQVPVALWRSPQSNNIQTDTLTELMFRGCEIDSAGTPQSHALAAQYQQTLVSQGLISQQDIDAGNNAKPAAGASIDTSPGNTIAPFGTDTGGLENQTSFPSTLQLSKHYTLGQLTMKPNVDFQHIVRDYNGLTAGQIVANLKLLAVNVLDPVLDQYPGMRITNTWRDDGPPYLTSLNQHPKGQAADMVFRSLPKTQYFSIAQWIKNNLPFDQLLLEWRGGKPNPSHWIHVSYNPKGNRPRSDQTSVMTFVNDKRHDYGLVDLSSNFL